jgi:hypothetical protein
MVLFPAALPSWTAAHGSRSSSGMIYTEEDWVDEEATSHRQPEE